MNAPWLLDTYVILWMMTDSGVFPAKLRKRLDANDQPLWFSAVSVMEIAILANLGRIVIDDDWSTQYPTWLGKREISELRMGWN